MKTTIYNAKQRPTVCDVGTLTPEKRAVNHNNSLLLNIVTNIKKSKYIQQHDRSARRKVDVS